MKLIPLSQGKHALVDDADYDYLAQFKWFVGKGTAGNTCYVVRNVRRDGKWTQSRMHRELLGLTAGEQADHVNGNGLDNRRKNIRRATQSQNLANRGPTKVSRSGLRGVSPVGNRWKARLCVNGVRMHLGSFASAIEAACAHDEAIAKFQGEFAWTNAGHGLV